MPEVLTQVDPDDSIEKFKAERGKVEYVADPKVKTLHGHVTAFDDATLLAANRNTERARLEHEVVEAAKAYGRAARAVEDHMKKSSETVEDSAAGWRLLRDMESTQETLMLEAIWPLLEFESQQGIKK